MSHLILIDANNLGFQSMNSPRLNAGEKPTQGTFNFLRKLRSIYQDNPNALIMCLWDGKSWRKEYYAEYKEKRQQTTKQQESRQEYYDQAKDIWKALTLLGVTQCLASNMEADDLAEIYSRKWIGDKVTLISGDKDWIQLVDYRTEWIDPIRDRICDYRNFFEFTGFYNSEQFVEAKCILGDKDEVPGIKGIGPKTLETIYKKWCSFPDYLLDKSKDYEPKVIQSLDINDTLKKVSENRILADLKTPFRPEPINLKRMQNPLDEEGFRSFCYENAFLSFTRDLDKFLKPFKGNKYVIK